MVSSCLFSFLNRCLASISSGASRRRRGRGRRPSHRAPARPRCSRRTSSPPHYAVRTRGGCSYKDYDTRESELIESDRGPWARRFMAATPPGWRATGPGQLEAVQSREVRAPARPQCSRRARPSSQQARYAVRTRGGCSYKATMPRRKATMPRRGELIATLHPKDDVIFPILIRHAAFRQHPPGLGDAGLVHGLRISADQVVPRRQIFPFGHQAVGAGRGKPGELRGAGRGQLHAVGHMLAPVGIVTAAAGLEVQQLAGDARVVDGVGVVLVLELLQAAQTAAVAQGLPLLAVHLFQGLALPEGGHYLCHIKPPPSAGLQATQAARPARRASPTLLRYRPAAGPECAVRTAP